ncbi:MAG: hypothetical protein IK082_11075 [Oscillospiraceae bacterium]|nr:hypothetical protein [Oscillospiraceae bacterium]
MKNTDEILKALSGFSDFRAFYEENAPALQSLSLSAALAEQLERRGLEKAAVIAKAEMSEVYAYQIFSGIRLHPARGKVLCLTLAMGMSFDETQTLLKRTGYPPLYAKDPFDCVVIYGILRGLSVVEVNALLYEYTGETLA